MSFEQPQAPQESGRETLREDLSRKIEAMNALQAEAAEIDIDMIDMTPDAIDEKAFLMTDVFTAAEAHPEEFLGVADQIKDPETRRDLTRKAIVAINASGDALGFETALTKYEGDLRSLGTEEATIEASIGTLRMEAIEKRIAALIDAGDVPEAVRTYVKDYRWRDSVVQNRVEGPMQKYVLGGESLDERLKRYNQLPDGYPGMDANDFALQIYRGETLGLHRMPDEERKAFLQEKFAQAPDIIARVSLDRNYGGWESEDRLEIFKKVRDAGNRDTVLSYFLEYDFTPEGFRELKPDLFKAYLAHRPDALLDRIDKFGEQFEALPDEERRALIGRWIAKMPEMTVFRLGKTLRVDAAQQDALIDRIMKEAPYRFEDPDFLAQLGRTEAEVVRRAKETGSSYLLLKARGLSDEATTELLNDVIADPPREFQPADLTIFLGRDIAFDPERVQRGLRKLLSKGKTYDLMDLARMTRVPFDVSLLTEKDLSGIPLTRIGEMLEAYPKLAERLPMAGVIGKLEKIQGRAARAEHDPWKQELDPLLANAYQEGILSPEKKEDAELFLEFIKEFGAVNTPKLFETYVGLKRAKTLEEIPEGVRKMLEETLGAKRVAKMKTPAFLLNEVRKFDRGMVDDLLMDEIPAGITSEIGLELFDQKKGASNWDQDDDPKELIGKWESFRKSSPERAVVPEGYVESRLTVPLAVREKRDFGMEIIGEDGVEQAFDRYADAFLESYRDIAPIAAKTADEEAEVRIYNEAVEYGGFQVPDGEEFNRLMEELVGMGTENARRLLFSLSINQIVRTGPANFADIIERTGETGHELDVERLRDLRDLLVDYVSEHYLHPSQAAHRVGHTPFSEKLRAELEKVWGLEDKAGNVVLDAHGRIEAQRKKNARTSKKSKDVALVPAQGLLRVYGGDIADACYTSRHNELADGKYPDLHAMTFVTGRGTASERFAGSVLFVEAETPPEAGGKKVLVVRANNPRENLIQEVDAGALIKQTLDAAIAIAKTRGLDMVVVPLDDASQSSSNRPAVADYYEEQFSGAEKVPLVRKSETNFNSYPNWDADGEHPVVKVWSREDERPG